MGGPNKKEAIAALHRQTILDAAEQVFYEKDSMQRRLKTYQKLHLIVVEQFTPISKTKKIFYTTSF